MNASVELDAIDLRVLRALQSNGRATYDELAALADSFAFESCEVREPLLAELQRAQAGAQQPAGTV